MKRVNVIANEAVPFEMKPVPPFRIVDSAAPAAHVDNLMDSQKDG
jgi:hypothetical protein